MVSRSRTRDGRWIENGWVTNSLGQIIVSGSANVGKIETCDDSVGEWEEANPFDLQIQENRRWVLKGTHVHPTTGALRNYTNMPMYTGWIVPPNLWSGFPALTLTELSNLGWLALARTNPNQAHVSLPTFIAELRDLPSLVKDWGGSLLRKIAKGHISWRWAVKPMIGDVKKLATFVKAQNERIRWLKRLRDGKALKKRTSLGSGHTFLPWTGTTLHSSSGVVISGQKREYHSYKQWGTVQWKLDPSVVLPETDDELAKLAFRLVRGITTHGALATAWELTPWSWFADWFGGFGDIISATNNTVPVIHSDVCVMRTSVSRREYRITSTDAQWKTLAKGVNFEHRTRKERRIATPIFPFMVNFPITDIGKWSILGSLAVLKGKRR